MQLDKETKQRVNSDIHNNDSDKAIMRSAQKMSAMTKHLRPVNIPAYACECKFGGLQGLE